MKEGRRKGGRKKKVGIEERKSNQSGKQWETEEKLNIPGE